MEKLSSALKHRARLLHNQIKKSDQKALKRLRIISDFRTQDEINLEDVQRKHCLSALALELGFKGWAHFCAVAEGKSHDFGKMLYSNQCSAHFNIWCTSYEEAQVVQKQNQGYLLVYQNQFIVTDEHFIRTLGSDPEDSDWKAIGRDWSCPVDIPSRTRLFEKILLARLESASNS